MKSRTHFVVPLVILLTVTLFVLPTPVRGAGLNLGWDDCGGQPASLDKVELTRFRGHLTIWVGGSHDAQESRTPTAVSA